MNDPRVYFAAERTLLAWVRTGLAMMGFGFVVARFGLFLRELASERGLSSQNHVGFSIWIGTALVLFGVVVNVAAAHRHWRMVKKLAADESLEFRPLSLGTVVAIVLSGLGLVVACYLVFGLSQVR